MAEAVSLGTVYSSAELRLDGFNRDWNAAIAKIKGLQEKLDGLKFDPVRITAGTEGVDKGFLGLTETLKKAQSALQRLERTEFKATGILRGADQAMRALGELAERTQLVSGRILDLSAKSTEAQGALRGLGTGAAGADKKVGLLAETAGAAAAAVSDAGKAGIEAGSGLDALGGSADLAKKSVSGLGRAAGLTATRLETLSLAKFDPAGIVAGADEGIGALERLRLAAQGVKNSLRMAPALSGVSGGGRRNAGGALLHGGGMLVGGAANAAAGATVVAGLDLKNYVEYSDTIQGVVGNTTMKPGDLAGMQAQTLRLMRRGASHSGGDAAREAALGYKHITNFQYHGADAAQIAEFGSRFAIATQTNTEETDDVLAGVMNAYKHMPARMVSRLGNTLHFAAAGSNMDVKDLEKNSTRTLGLAANYMGPAGLPDALAAYSALVQHRINPSRADTQVSGMLGQVAAPSNKALGEAKKLGLKNFNAEGLRRVQLTGVLDEVKNATAKLPENDKAASLKLLFNNKQGGIGATFLTGAANETMHSALNDPKTGTKAAFAGKADAITPLYKQAMANPAQQVRALGGELKADSIEVGKSFVPLLTAAVPVLKMFADQVQRVVGFLAKLPQPVQEALLGLGAFKLATVALGNPLLGLGEGIGALVTKLGGLEGGAAALSGLGAAAGPIALVAAAVIAFGVAWKTNFGGIRQAFAPFLADVKTTFGGSGKEITDFVKVTLPDLKKFVHEVEPLFAGTFRQIASNVKIVFDVIKAVVKVAFAVLGGVFRTGLALMTGDWKGAWAGIKSIFSGTWAAILGLANDLAPQFVAWISHLGQEIKSAWTRALNALKSAFSGGARELVDAFGAGLRNGIASVGPSIQAAASSVAGLIPTSVRSVLKIHSPSRVMHEIGRNTSQGLADGISAGKSQVTAAMRGVVQAALKETDHKKAAFLIDHEARSLRSGGMSASDVADFRQSAHAQLGTRRGGRSKLGTRRGGRSKLDAQRHTAGEFAATVGETPEQKQMHRLNEDRAKGLNSAAQYSAAYERIMGHSHKKVEAALKAHLVRVAEITKSLAALTASMQAGIARSAGNDPLAEKIEATQSAKNMYDDNLASLKEMQAKYGLSDKDPRVSAAKKTALAERDAAILRAGQDYDKSVGKNNAATADVQAGIDQMTDKAAEDKHPYDFQRDQAQKKYGKDGAEIKAGADPVKTAEALRLALKAVDDEEAKDAKETEDRRQQYLLATNQISLAVYRAYLDKRKKDYQDYSSEWVQISQSINDIDLQLWKEQEDALKQKFDAGLIDLKDYIAQMKALEAALPKTASPDAKAEVDDTLAHAQGKEKKEDDREMVGGAGFWKDLTDSAADGGSHFLTALLHPKDRKSIFKSMQTDMMSSLEGGLTKGLASMLKNMITGGMGSGFNLGSLFGGLFGSGHKAAASSYIPGNPFSGSGALGSDPGMGGGVGSSPGMGGGVGSSPGMGGGVGSSPAGLLGMLGKGGLGGIAKFLPWLGGGILLNKVLGNPLGKLFKHFHFAKGTLSVPGSGSHDSVPAMLTPGEMVLPKAGAQLVRDALQSPSFGGKGSGGSAASLRPAGNTSIHVTHNGDINNQADAEHFHEDTAWHVQQRLATAI